MTPEERNTVIEALETARTACTSSSELREINKALAIMRREREPQGYRTPQLGACRHEWIKGGPMNNFKTICVYCTTAGN